MSFSMSIHNCISFILSFFIVPKSLSSILLSPINLKYKKSVVNIGGVLNNLVDSIQDNNSFSSYSYKKSSLNQVWCRTSIAYLNDGSKRYSKLFIKSKPSAICREGGNFKRNTSILSYSGSIAS